MSDTTQVLSDRALSVVREAVLLEIDAWKPQMRDQARISLVCLMARLEGKLWMIEGKASIGAPDYQI